MRIRSDTTITSGTIDVVGSLKPNADGQAITGSITTAQLAATKAGKQLSWDQPVNANFAIRRTNGVVALDSLSCDSKFLRIEAAGTQQQLTANASFDLNALSEQLGQFVDLSGMQLAGTGSAQVAWQQPADGKFSAKASTDLSQLQVALGDGTVWSEPQLTLRAEAGGSMDPKTHQPTRVDTAQLQINGQGDLLDARLVSAVDTDKLNGRLPNHRPLDRQHRPLAHARPTLVRTGQWNIDGASDFTADLRLAGNAFEATNTKLVVTNLRASSPDWNINESRIEFAGDARWNGATGELAANSAQLVSSTVAVAAKGVHYGGSQPGANNLSGAAAFRTDLARLAILATLSHATAPIPTQRRIHRQHPLRSTSGPHHRRDQRDGSERNPGLSCSTSKRRRRRPPVTKPSGKNPKSPSKAPPTTTPPPTASASTNSKSNRTPYKPTPPAKSKNSPPSPNAI